MNTASGLVAFLTRHLDLDDDTDEDDEDGDNDIDSDEDDNEDEDDFDDDEEEPETWQVAERNPSGVAVVARMRYLHVRIP